jgi:ribosomal protein S18 acetylase RimI-like enzyme
MLYINDIVVREEYRGKGIGRYLLTYIAQYAKELKVDTLELNVFAANISAVHLYESFGFADLNKRMVIRL